MSPADAERFGVGAGDMMDLEIEHASCPVRLGAVRVRIDPLFKLQVHIDSDEGNACDLPGATGVRLVKRAGQ
jgi:propanediol utilization protein